MSESFRWQKMLLMVGLLTIVFFGVIVFRYCGGQNLSEIEIKLGGPLSELDGHKWPRYKEDNRLFNVAWIDQPALVKLRLPSGREIKMVSKGTWLGVETNKISEYGYSYAENQDTINHVSILPLLESVRPDELAGEVDRLATDLGLIKDPDFKQRLDSLEAKARTNSTCPDFAFYTNIEQNVSLDIGVKTHQGFWSEGCYIVVDFWWSLE